ncbi:uncharacterized protein [Aristolochia californica]|uniref:uncharacterized protein n=1 Tax=Aristolochia californica TaxID=171875 RepID=UPI0035E1C116
MAVDIPTSVIRKLQLDLRAAVGLSSYDPDDPGLSTKLPTLREAIAEFDPSPSCIRCDQCRGKLLRDIKSMFCVYCGAQQRRKEAPCPSISFNTTSGYRRLLESLQLDGSEAVLGPDETDSSGGQNAPRDSLTLSDFLDLKLKWPEYSSQSENNTNKASTPSAPSMNLAGIDLDNFFLDARTEAVPTVSNKELGNKIGMPVSTHESSEMFQDFQSPIKEVESVNNVTSQFVDSSSLWEANFQSANSGGLHPASKPIDSFQVSTVDPGRPSESASMTDPITNSKFDISQSSTEENNINEDSALSDWPQNDLWNSEDIVASPSIELFETSHKNEELVNDTNSVSPMMENWSQDVTEHRKNSAITVTAENHGQSDLWQNMAISTDGQDPSSISWPQNDPDITATNRSANLSLGLIDDSHEVSFDTFSQPNHPSSSTSISKGAVDLNLFQMGISPPERMKETEHISRVSGKNSGVNDKVETYTSTASSVDADVEMLMSQMHDLSFMLENKLSIPEKFEDSNSIL